MNKRVYKRIRTVTVLMMFICLGFVVLLTGNTYTQFIYDIAYILFLISGLVLVVSSYYLEKDDYDNR
ncbi:hypothetical protein LMK04_12235 (plasmid) [Lactococcus petauri]|jgi:hypothetical protein|nr:hypothetical protein LMK04_12235 [Lactococcus petauri]